MVAFLALSARIGTGCILGACAVLAGCGGDSSDPEPGAASNTTNPGVGNTSTVTDSTSSTSTSGAGGMATAATAETATTGGVTGPCSMTVPPNATISDFSDWAPNNTWGAEGNLTGGTFGPYRGPNTTDFEFTVVDEELQIVGTVNDYAGFGMWFGPCTDASGFSGIQFDISGSAGEAGRLVVQAQTSETQAIDVENMRGECEADCANPQAAVETIAEDVATIQLAWADFSGGSPVDGLSPDQVLALQFQAECETDMMCEVNIVIDNLQFY